MGKMQTFLWFRDGAEQAVEFYKGLFADLKVGQILRYGPGMPAPEGSVMTVSFELFGQSFVALNGNPEPAFSPTVSFLVNCDTQEEIDRYWDGLLEGGQALACGWVTDRFGVTWQITPRPLMGWIGDSDPVKSQRVMESMMSMIKLDIEALRRAYEA